LTQTWPGPAPAAAAEEPGDGVDGAGAGVVAAGAVPQLCTPPCPRQAPLRVVPLKDEPSLHVAVTDAGVWANVASAKPEQAIREAAISRLFMGAISHLLSGGATDDCIRVNDVRADDAENQLQGSSEPAVP